MNLVAKEYVAAQSPADPGVLVLSKFAGAANELDAALLVNPHDIDSMARTIATALTMQDAGNKLREKFGNNYLAEKAVEQIAKYREAKGG